MKKGKKPEYPEKSPGDELHMLHVISAQYVGHDLHTIVPGSLECTCWRLFVTQ